MIGCCVLEPSSAAILPLLPQGAITALEGWSLSRWMSRRKPVRWGVVAIEVASVGAHLTLVAIDGDFGWTSLLSLSVLLPLAVVIPLLTPPAARWFDR
ncbi:hypothetical protein [Nonomuraea sp. NPDC049400]|uniref:hypothetical protein n=1 Tax=Nonomuraea sp. NPDC049400 TaxID=3364352 RepID=UPI0037B34FB3